MGIARPENLVRVLMLGGSDTLGSYLPDRSQSTHATLVRELPDRLRRPVTVEHSRFYPHFPNAPRHAEDLVRNAEPDVVVLFAQSFSFLIPSLGARLVHLFGWKVGRWLERRIWDADARARKGGPLRLIRNPVRAVAYRVIGTATYSTVEETIATYAETIRRVARIEGTHLFVASDVVPVPGVPPNTAYNRAIQAAAAQHRAPWIDRQGIADSLGDAAFQTERVGMTAIYHRHVADALMQAIEAAL